VLVFFVAIPSSTGEKWSLACAKLHCVRDGTISQMSPNSTAEAREKQRDR
jgi:hypothetical protein